jgi:hypothetical protein
MRMTDEQIGAELRALREVPTERFAAELDAWAAEGFPSLKDIEEPGALSSRPQRAQSRVLGLFAGRPALAALAGCMLVVIIVGVSVAGYLGFRDSRVDTASRGGELGPVIEESLPPVGKDATEAVRSVARPRNDRAQVQEQTASLGLATDAGKLQDAADGVAEVTQRYGGFVDSSTVHVGGSRGHASFALRIPTAHLNDAMSDLSDLGHVTSSDTGSTNVTGTYADAVKAYRDARAKVDSLLADLHKASSLSEAASIKRQLIVARGQLASARAALRGIKQHVALTPVNVQIAAQGDGNWSIGDAADDAVGVLEAIGGALLIALAVLVPLAALIALGWLGARELARRRREAPLDR